MEVLSAHPCKVGSAVHTLKGSGEGNCFAGRPWGLVLCGTFMWWVSEQCTAINIARKKHNLTSDVTWRMIYVCKEPGS